MNDTSHFVFLIHIAPLSVSPTSEQSAAVPVASHDVPKFGGLGDLSSGQRVSPPVSTDHTTEEECASEEDEDDTEDDNPITSTPMPQQQPTTNKQVRKMIMVLSVKIPFIPSCTACQTVH